jgi:uncharacterized protein
MIVDLSSIIKVTGAQVGLDGFVELNEAEFLGESYRFDSPLKITGRIYNNGQSLTLDATVKGKMKTECARCLKEIEEDVDFDIDELLSKNEEGVDTDGDLILFDGHEIDISGIVADRFLMNISGRYLCDEDCKGLCPVCGHDLNESDCGCDNEYIDPRWQALADILNQQNDE